MPAGPDDCGNKNGAKRPPQARPAAGEAVAQGGGPRAKATGHRQASGRDPASADVYGGGSGESNDNANCGGGRGDLPEITAWGVVIRSTRRSSDI